MQITSEEMIVSGTAGAYANRTFYFLNQTARYGEHPNNRAHVLMSDDDSDANRGSYFYAEQGFENWPVALT
jgi:hypothetical protein